MAASLDLWIEYIMRFAHLVAGISWIGSSFYFIWMDSAFEAPEVARRNVDGELYMVHGGFYYQVEKRKIYPGELPKVLHWFKWESAYTVLTGYLLFIYLYWMNGANLLINFNTPLTQTQTIFASIGLILSGWIIYDSIWQYISSKVINLFLSTLLLVGFVFVNFKYFSGRGAFIQTGAMLATIMLLNVWLRILPRQKKMLLVAKEGKVPDYSLGGRAKTRSVHNTYFTFPVLFIMISNHYPMVYNHHYNWLLLITLAVSGALTRHAIVTKESRERWTLVPAAIGLIGLVYFTGTFELGHANNEVEKTSQQIGHTFALSKDSEPELNRVMKIVQARCWQCHSSHPTDEAFKTAPKGLTLENEQQMRQALPQLYQQVVLTSTMPLANKTQMTPEEREILSSWIRVQGKF